MGKLVNAASQDAQQQMYNELAARFILPKLEAAENLLDEEELDGNQYKIEDHKVFKLDDRQLDAIVDKIMQL